MMRKLIGIMIALTLACSLTACTTAANDGATLTLKVGMTTAPDGHYAKGMEEFQRLLDEYSNGEIALEIYPNSQLGNERDLVEGVSLGTIPMALVSTGPFPNFLPDFAVLDLPYLFQDAQAAYSALDGEVGLELLGQLEEKGIKGLGFYENGFRHVTNNKQEILLPADVKGMKIRTMENDIHMNTYRQYGANPTPMAWSEIFSALQQGTVDGQENPTIIIETAKVYEVQKYMSLTGNFYSPCVLIMNKKLFYNLSQADREIIERASEEAKHWQREYSQNYEQEALEKLRAAGCIISEVDTAAWKDASQGTYRDYEEKLNQDMVNRILQAQDSKTDDR